MARLLENDALQILQRAGIPVPRHEVVSAPEAARNAANQISLPAVLKPLIPAGGRGKAGAIRKVSSPDDAWEQSRDLLGKTILNFPVNEVLLCEAVAIRQEYFVSLTFDSRSCKPLLLFSTLGGVEVETILKENPAALIEETIDLSIGLQFYKGREIAERAGLTGSALSGTADVLSGLYRVFCELDAETLEINPLALAEDGKVVALSAVIVADNQALFRHPELEGIADPDRTNGWRPLSPLEKKMREIDRTDASSAIRFNEFDDGDIAFMVTGGGAGFLAFDTIMRIGGKPATTFDITPGRVEEKMYLATKAILSKPGLKGLIAGGNITNFIPIDVKTRGVMRALKEMRIDPERFPVVFRFAGPGEEKAKELASELPGIHFYDSATSIEDSVKKIVQLVKDR